MKILKIFKISLDDFRQKLTKIYIELNNTTTYDFYRLQMSSNDVYLRLFTLMIDEFYRISSNFFIICRNSLKLVDFI